MNEYRGIKADKMERISLWLAVSPWLFGLTQLLGVPGFG